MFGKQRSAGIILSYLSQGLHILVTLFYTPLMLRLLGQSEYGLYQIAYSVVSYLSLFTFGFSSAYVKFFSKAKVDSNPDEALRKVNGMFMTVFSFLGLLVLILGAFLVFNSEAVLGTNLTSEELDTCKILMAIMVVNCAINFPTTVFSNYFIANEKFIFLQTIGLIGIIINPCLTFPLLLLGFKSVSLASVMLAISLFKLVAYLFYSVVKLKMRFQVKGMKLGLLKDISAFSLFIFIESVVSTINMSLDRFLLGRLVGSVSAAIYSVGGQINTLYITLSTSISSVFTPKINMMVETGKKRKDLSDMFIKIGKIQFMVLYLILLGFTVFGKRFIEIWAGTGYENAFYVALVLIWPNTINLIQNIAIEIQRALGLQKYRSFMYLGIAIMNIVISVFFIGLWGEVGAALGTCIAWIIGSGIVMNIFYYKKVQLDIKGFWKNIISIAKIGIPLLIIGWVMQNLITNCSVVVYFGLIGMFTVCYIILLYFWGMSGNEKAYIKNLVGTRLKRNKTTKG